MRGFFRWMRRGLTLIFIGLAIYGIGWSLYTMTTGIYGEVEFRREQAQRDVYRRSTATALAPTVAAESEVLASYDISDQSSVDVVFDNGNVTEETVIETDEPTIVAVDPTEIPSEIPLEVVEPTDEPTNASTDEPPTIEVTPEDDNPDGVDAVTDEPATEEPTGEVNAGVIPTIEEPTDAPSDTPEPATDIPSDTPTDEPTDEPTAVAQVSPSDTATDIPEPTDTLTPTPTNSATPEPSATPFPTNTEPPTAFPTNTLPPTETYTPTDTLTPSITPTPTDTFTPTATNTATNTPLPTLVIEGTYVTPIFTPISQIEISAPLMENDPDIVNILLLGSDTTTSALGQTDVIIIVSINKKAETVAMWHLPRDLLVYIPGNTIDRINRAFPIGAQNGWPGGGPGLMKDTIRYNFGIEIDFYARVSFSDFQEIITQLGGLTISVDCPITDWRLIDPTTPRELYDSDDWELYWEQYTLGVGVHDLNPYMALWYARSRVTTNDFDRGRRQMDILRAMWHQARDQGLFSQVIDLYPQAIEIIDTDMKLEDMLEFVPLAVSLDLGDIERYNLTLGVHVDNWFTPDDGRAVLVPDWTAIRLLAQQFVTPPTTNRLTNSSTTIEIYDGTLYGLGWSQVAADRLAWEGFIPVIIEDRTVARHDVTLVYDYTGDTKGSSLSRIQKILRIGDGGVYPEPDPNREYDYRVVVGRNYNACIYTSSADEVEIPERPVDVSGN